MEDVKKTRPEQPSPAKQAEVKALGHAAALSALSKEFPPENRSPEDEQYLGQLLQEGRQLRAEARQAQPPGRTINTDPEGIVLRDQEVIEHVAKVREGENPDIVSNDLF